MGVWGIQTEAFMSVPQALTETSQPLDSSLAPYTAPQPLDKVVLVVITAEERDGEKREGTTSSGRPRVLQYPGQTDPTLYPYTKP